MFIDPKSKNQALWRSAMLHAAPNGAEKYKLTGAINMSLLRSEAQEPGARLSHLHAGANSASAPATGPR